ncbi:MAG TPA: zf-HC2 domain-containing protein [Pyrinomonadaceae bacterium]|nr:zf-HC2 domain-containing protein [Pyrinomonadaceae bacterium]
MDCVESITLLSEYHEGALDEPVSIEVRIHLRDCPPCADVYNELKEIVTKAVALREYQEINFPDENSLWLRMRLAEREAH